MESLNLLLPSIPVPMIVAFLAGIFFLYRAWGNSHSVLSTRILQNNPKITAEDTTTNQAKDESTTQQTVSKESDFPANWWTGKGIFDLERRAVFSKTWLYVSHRSRFTKPGDYHSSELAGFPIFLIMGKDDQVRAFHNVCRHRAYTVTRRDAGSSTVLGCKYHGWTYNTYGHLVKAPHFDDVPGFEKSENGLFEIHTRVSEAGFIFVNLDAGPVVSEVEMSAMDSLASRNGVGVKSTWIGGQTLEGKFGWKLGLRLNQCLDATKLESRIYQSAGLPLATKLGGYIMKRKSEGVSVFPNVSFHAVSNTELVYSLSVVPVSEEKSLIRYDVFSSRGQNNANAGEISETLKDFLNEGIGILEREYQCHVSRSDQPTPDLAPEAGETQKQILEKLKSHTKLEKTLGTEVYPAMRQPKKSQRFKLADKLCKDLDCFSGAMGGGGLKAGGEVLAW